MIFEKAAFKDIDLLITLRLAYLLEDYGSIPETVINQISHKLHEYYHQHLNKDLFVYAARNNEDIVSCCFLLIIEKPANPSFINGKIGSVLNVYTKPDYRKKGLAWKLLQQLLVDSESMGLDFVELKSTDAGYTLYKSLGFEDAVSKYHNMKIVFNHNQ